MGVGKTTVCKILKNKLKNCVFLDGDWCWDMHPFVVNNETKAMVMGNIRHMLNAFLKCSVYDNVVFCWVMHEKCIIDDILSGLDISGCEVLTISLICTEKALEARLAIDAANGIREKSVIERSVKRLPLYGALDTIKIDVSEISAEEAAEAISKL